MRLTVLLGIALGLAFILLAGCSGRWVCIHRTPDEVCNAWRCTKGSCR